jgi:hypothetical protein
MSPGDAWLAEIYNTQVVRASHDIAKDLAKITYGVNGFTHPCRMFA